MDSIYHIGITQAIFAAFLFLTKNKKSLADRFIIGWLLLIAVEFTHSMLNFYYINSLPDLIIFPYAYGPCIYFYTKSLIDRDPKFRKKDYIHFSPVIIFLLIGIFWPGEINISTKDFWGSNSIVILGFLNTFLFFISILFYWIKVFKMLKVHHSNIGHEFSYTSELITLNWLKTNAWFLFLAFSFVQVLNIFFLFRNIAPFNPVLIFHLVLIFFMFSISFYGFKQPDIFEPHKFKRFNNPESSKYKKSGLKEKEENELLSRIMNFMKEEKPYLNRELTLQDISNQIDIPTHHISQTINKQLNKNFFSFINEFRVEEAKQRILDDKNKNLTLLAIAYDSGFNSKSTFNDIFKRMTNKTPSEFRKSILL